MTFGSTEDFVCNVLDGGDKLYNYWAKLVKTLHSKDDQGVFGNLVSGGTGVPKESLREAKI